MLGNLGKSSTARAGACRRGTPAAGRRRGRSGGRSGRRCGRVGGLRGAAAAGVEGVELLEAGRDGDGHEEVGRVDVRHGLRRHAGVVGLGPARHAGADGGLVLDLAVHAHGAKSGRLARGRVLLEERGLRDIGWLLTTSSLLSLPFDTR